MAQVIHLRAQVSGIRIDRYLAERLPQLSRSQIQKLIAEGLIRVEGRAVRPSHRVGLGEEVVVTIPPPPDTSLMAQPLPLNIVYEDGDLLVIDKPPGLTVHPGPGHPDRTLINAILAHAPEVGQIEASLRPGIVHRLDKDTSGLIVIAKNKRAQLELARQIKERQVTKGYLALVPGCPEPPKGTIDTPIGRHPIHRKKMAVVAWGRPARTHYRVIRQLGQFSLVEAKLETGRTHQIRVHLASIGHPVVGDGVYGPRVPFLARQFLHAFKLGFYLPSSGEYREFTSELPPDLREALAFLGG